MFRITCKVRAMQSSESILSRKKLLYIPLAFVSTESLCQVQRYIIRPIVRLCLQFIQHTHTHTPKFPGSPFSCKVVGVGQATISGHNLKMGAVKRLISFTVDPQAASTNCDVIATPPSGIALPITIEPIDGKYNVSFVPTEVGRHNVSVLVDGESIKGSPFACNIYDVTKVSFVRLEITKSLFHGNKKTVRNTFNIRRN